MDVAKAQADPGANANPDPRDHANADELLPEDQLGELLRAGRVLLKRRP